MDSFAVPLGHGAFLFLSTCPTCLALVQESDMRTHRRRAHPEGTEQPTRKD